MKFNQDGLIPVVTQNVLNGDVLMLAYMNEEAYQKTLETGFMHYFSRSRQKLWKKGETSGALQKVVRGYLDCDSDTLLFQVYQEGTGACHTGNKTCFFELITEESTIDYKIIFDVKDTISQRKTHPVEGSYTNYLFNKGLDKILKKVGEESTEVCIAAKNKDKTELVMELSDLLYHSLVLMENEGIELSDIYKELISREGRKPHPKYSKS